MEEIQNRNAIGKSENFIRIKDLFYLVLAKWQWVVASVIVALVLAFFYLQRTTPTYTRSASVLIKDSYNGATVSSDLGSFSELGLFQSNVDVNNELIAFQSPVLMSEVVKRLDLNMSYSAPGVFRDYVLYGGSLPVKAKIFGISENDYVKLRVRITPKGEVSISNLTYYRDNEKIEDRDNFSGVLEDSIQTPVGKIIIIPTEYCEIGKFEEGIEIDVTHISSYDALGAYQGKLMVSLCAEKAAVINLKVIDQSVQRADDVLNTLIDVYNESWINDKNRIATSTSKFINDRLSLIERELGIVDEDISSFRSKNLIPDDRAVSGIYLQQSSAISREILELNNQLYMVNYLKKYMADKSYQESLLPANLGIGNAGLEKQITEFNNKLLLRNNLISNSSVENPLVMDLNSALIAMREAINTSIENQIVTLDSKIQSLQDSEKKTTSRIAAGPEQVKYLVSVERQQKVKEALYVYLLQKREENELSQAFTAYNTRIIATPNGSRFPTAPVHNKAYLIALFFGLLIPIVVVLILETANTKVRGRKDVENLSIPFIGEIPLYVPHNKKISGAKNTNENKIVVYEGCRNIINEAFRVVRTNFEFINGKNDSSSNVSIVTSFNPGSGKSFITMNMALSLAIKGKKVLVIDGDFRHASTSTYVDSPKRGISNYLAGGIEDFNTIIVGKLNNNLDVIPVGTIPPNPAELLFEENLKLLVESVRTRYDYIFIDCPPIDLVADTQILEKLADRTIFIIRSGLLERAMLPELEKIYTEKKYKNMSIILNGTEENHGSYGYRYGYGYHSNYYLNSDED